MPPSAFGRQAFAAGSDRLAGHQHEGDDAGRRALVHPVVDGAALHQHVAGLEVHALAIVELHVDLAGDHGGIVDRIGAVVAALHARAEAHHPEYRPVVERGANLAPRRVAVAVVVHWKSFGGPDVGGVGAWPALVHVLGDLVDLHDRVAVLVVAGDDAADGERHGGSP